MSLLDFTIEAQHTKFADCVIICNQQKYLCHRIKLHHIEYFFKCFDDNFKINKDDQGRVIVQFDNKFSPVINNFLNLVYNEYITSIKKEDIEISFEFYDYILYPEAKYKVGCRLLNSLYYESDHYGLFNDDCIDECVDFLSYFDKEDAIKIFQQMIQYNLESFDYLFFCVVFYQRVGRIFLPHIEVYKIVQDDIVQEDIEKLKEYDRYHPILFYIGQTLFDKEIKRINERKAHMMQNLFPCLMIPPAIMIDNPNEYKHLIRILLSNPAFEF